MQNEKLARSQSLEEWKENNLHGQLHLPYPPAADGTRFELEPDGGDAAYGKAEMITHGPYAA